MLTEEFTDALTDLVEIFNEILRGTFNIDKEEQPDESPALRDKIAVLEKKLSLRECDVMDLQRENENLTRLTRTKRSKRPAKTKKRKKLKKRKP